MAEGGGPVLLEEEVADPGQRIAGHQRRQQPPRVALRDRRGHEDQARAAAGEMQAARGAVGDARTGRTGRTRGSWRNGACRSSGAAWTRGDHGASAAGGHRPRRRARCVRPRAWRAPSSAPAPRASAPPGAPVSRAPSPPWRGSGARTCGWRRAARRRRPPARAGQVGGDEQQVAQFFLQAPADGRVAGRGLGGVELGPHFLQFLRQLAITAPARASRSRPGGARCSSPRAATPAGNARSRPAPRCRCRRPPRARRA